MSDWVGPLTDPDRYELLELRGRGAEGELWRGAIAVDGQQLPVAVKVLHASSAAELGAWSERWRAQAELLRSLEHPSLVKIREVFEGPRPHNAGAADSATRALYLVMNWADGDSLPTWVAQHPDRDVLEVTRFVTRIAGAVAYLHSGKATGGVPVLHRDIKPANVIVDGPDVRLVDFGFARLAGDRMTIAGTPSYLAPEVVAGAQPSEASDRYSLGATAYFLFTGEDPALNEEAAMRAKLIQVRGIEGRDDIADHLLSMMARDPSRRPANVIDWAQALAVGTVSERLTAAPLPPAAPASPRDHPRPSRRSRSRLVVSLVVGLVLVVAGVVAALALTGGGSKRKHSSFAGATSTKTISMPDVTGRSLANAEAQLNRAGIHDIAVTNQQSTQPDGTVIASDPSAGTKVSGAVTLTVARKPSSIPDVVGKSLSDATNTLQALGITATPKDVADTTHPDGTVIAESPTAGSPFASQVTLSVARQLVGTFLADLQPVQSTASFSKMVGTIAGQSYAHAVVVQLYSNSPEQLDYNLGTHYEQLKGTMGLSDDAPSAAQVKLEILGDGRPLLSQTVSLGHAVPVNLDVTGVLRLTLAATYLNGNDPAVNGQGAKAVWGDVEAFGAPSAVGDATSTTVPGLGSDTTPSSSP